jgi:general secretion pathway protein E
MPEPKKLTFENLAHLMERRGLLSRDQLHDVLSRKKAQESRLFAHHHSGTSRTYEEVISMTG